MLRNITFPLSNQNLVYFTRDMNMFVNNVQFVIAVTSSIVLSEKNCLRQPAKLGGELIELDPKAI